MVYATVLLAGCICAAPFIHVRRTQFVESRSGNTFASRLSSVSGIALCDDAIGAFGDAFTDASEVRLVIRDVESRSEICNISFPAAQLGTGVWGEAAESSDLLHLEKGESYQYSVLIDGADEPSVSLRLLGDPYPGYLFPMLIFVSTAGVSLVVLLLFRPVLPGISADYNKAAGHPYSDQQRECGSRISIRRFVLVFLLCGFLNVMWMPGYSVPDEPEHMANTYALLDQLRGNPVKTDKIQYRVDGIRRGFPALTAENTAAFYSDFHYGNGRFAAARPTQLFSTNIPHYCYLPAAVGVWIADALHLPYQFIFLSGKISSLLFAAFLASVSMKLSPELKPAIAAICLLPATVWLCASYSYDVWNLSLIIFFVSMCQWIRNKGRARLQDLIVLVIVFLLMVPIKYVYVVLGFWILTFGRSLTQNRRLLAGLSVGGILAVLVLLVSRGEEIWRLATTSHTDPRADAAGDSYTLGFMIHHPFRTLLVMLHTFFRQVQDLLTRMTVGEFYSRYVPGILTALIIVIFLLSMATSLPKAPSGRVRLLAAFIILGGTVLVNLAFLLSFSRMDGQSIGEAAGMQGRYFLPFTLLVPFACCSSRLKKCVQYIGMKLHCEGTRLLPVLMALCNVLVLYCKILGFALEGGPL